MVAGRIDEDLRLPLEPAEGLRVQDAVTVPLKRRAQSAAVLFAQPAARLVRPNAQRRQPGVFVLADLRLEGIRNSSGKLGHRFER